MVLMLHHSIITALILFIFFLPFSTGSAVPRPINPRNKEMRPMGPPFGELSLHLLENHIILSHYFNLVQLKSFIH